MSIINEKPINIGSLNEEVTRTKEPQSDIGFVEKQPDNEQPIDDIIIAGEYLRIKALIENNNPVTFVTGNAGTGKSTLIDYLQKVVDKQCVVVAPTGVAALNVNGVTIHSFFQFPPRIIEKEDIKEIYDRKLYRKLELLIVDEVSMVRADIIDGIDLFLRKNRDNDQPFGGVQLLLIGDLFQLPPVTPRREEQMLQTKGYKSSFFFSAFSLQQLNMISVELTRIFRQKDPEYIEILNNIRLAENLYRFLRTINSKCNSKGEPLKDRITLTSTNHIADRKNSFELSNLKTKQFTFLGSTTGKFPISEEKLPSPVNLVLKEGAHVMFTKNDENKCWVNGSLGIVRELSQESIIVELVSESQRKVEEVHRTSWKKYSYKYEPDKDQIVATEIGKYTQYPLMLAWAVTIHKSQGKTLDSIYLDIGHGAFASGQVYVALSRIRSLDGLKLARPISARDVICDTRIKKFYQIIQNSSNSD